VFSSLYSIGEDILPILLQVQAVLPCALFRQLQADTRAQDHQEEPLRPTVLRSEARAPQWWGTSGTHYYQYIDNLYACKTSVTNSSLAYIAYNAVKTNNDTKKLFEVLEEKMDYNMYLDAKISGAFLIKPEKNLEGYTRSTSQSMQRN
jgi:hypothetical protein